MRNPLANRWGGNARQAREAAQLTQVEAAARADTTQHNLSRIERGDQFPSYDLQGRLARVYGVSVTELFPRTDAEAALAETVAELEDALARTGGGCS